MLLNASMKLYFLLSIITILTLNSVHAKKPKKTKANNDKFYMVFAENGSDDGKNKREEKNQFLDALVTEINNLIIGNKDTYDDPSKLKILEEAPAPETPFTKRSNVKDDKEDEDDEEDDDGEVEAEDHKFAYVISSLEKESVISSYLSEDLVPLVKDMPNVRAVVPDFKLESTYSRSNYLKEIKETNKWEHPCVKGNTYNHLSLISQDKFDDSKNNSTYDESFYYPSSAGEGINIFILDTGFNFNYKEYSNRSTKENKNGRITTCIGSARSNRSFLSITEKCTDKYDDGHGNVVANVAAGLENGVASKANIYGFISQGTKFDPEYTFASSILQGLEHINSRYLNENNPENVKNFLYKSVINMSCGYFFSKENSGYDDKKDFTEYLGQLLKRMSNKGVVIVASAGNHNLNIDDIYYPCNYDDVICVGATDNIGINDDYYTVDKILKLENNTSVYPDHDKWEKIVARAKARYYTNFDKFFDNKFVLSKYYKRAYFSNYGKKVDVYAPGYVKAFYKNGTDHELIKNWYGTSFSSPIVAGVAATIMSENPHKNYTTIEMKKELQEIGLKNIVGDIGKDQPNIFINNGKHLRFNRYGYEEEDDYDDGEVECFNHGCCLIN